MKQKQTPEWVKYLLTYFFIFTFLVSGYYGIISQNNLGFAFLMWIIFFYCAVFIFLQGHAISHNHFKGNRTYNRILGNIIMFLIGPMTFQKWTKLHLNHHKNLFTTEDSDFHGKTPKSGFDYYDTIVHAYKQRWTVITNVIIALCLAYWLQQNFFWVFGFIMTGKVFTSYAITIIGGYMPHYVQWYDETKIPKWLSVLLSLGNFNHIAHHKYPSVYSMDLPYIELGEADKYKFYSKENQPKPQ